MQNKGRSDYYSLVCGLPEITLEQTSDPDYRNLIIDYKDYINETDQHWLQLVYDTIDLKNFLIVLFKSGKELQPGGSYSQVQLEEAASQKIIVFSYQELFFNAFDNAPTEHPIAVVEHKLFSLYYTDLINCGNAFLENWGRFSLALKNYVLMLYSDNLKIDIQDRLIAEPLPLDKIQIRTLEQYLNETTNTSGIAELIGRSDISIKEKYIDQLQWDYLNAASFFEYFSLEKLIAFALKNQLANRWKNLSDKSNTITTENILNAITEFKHE